MERIILERLETSDQGTFGKIRVGNDTFYSLELPWRDNSSNVSCIPAGVYECRYTMSAHFKRRLYLVDEVNGRTGIRIHSANLAGDATLGFKKQLNGCIALGMNFGVMDVGSKTKSQKQKCILNSTTAVRQFENLMERQSFLLEIQNGY